MQVLMSRPREETRADVAARYRALEQFSKEDARVQFLRILRSLPYGAPRLGRLPTSAPHMYACVSAGRYKADEQSSKKCTHVQVLHLLRGLPRAMPVGASGLLWLWLCAWAQAALQQHQVLKQSSREDAGISSFLRNLRSLPCCVPLPAAG